MLRSLSDDTVPREELRFPHHSLEAYRAAIELARKVRALTDQVPRGHRQVADQMIRAATSVVLNIAEAANRVSGPDKMARYAIARGEAGEVAAAAEVAALLGLARDDDAREVLRAAWRVGALLHGLVRSSR